MPVGSMVRALAFSSEDETREYLDDVGMTLSADGKDVDCKNSTFLRKPKEEGNTL
jgi:hypothetical protein